MKTVRKSILTISLLILVSLPTQAQLVGQYNAQSIAGSQAPPNYGLRLDGFYGNEKDEVTFHFENVFFSEYEGGRARLHGSIVVAEFNDSNAPGDADVGPGTFAGFRYTLDVEFRQLTDPDDIDKIKDYNPDWRYYMIVIDRSDANMVNADDETDYATLRSYPPGGCKPFQVGYGANGKNDNFGASGWLTYKHHMDEDRFCHGENDYVDASDFLMDLFPASTDIGDGVNGVMPKDFALGANYPNPFNPSTSIPYKLSTASHVRIDVYNQIGQRVNTLLNDFKSAGEYVVMWNGRDYNGKVAPSGVYFYRFQTDHETTSRKMILLK